MAKYISVTETASLIRSQLKAKFASIKFSVRSDKYAGGASINISWTDGPTAKMVDAITKAYQGKGFDGMIDMAYYKDSYLLPDGSAEFAGTKGTAGSGGMDPEEHHMMPPVEGVERVHFGADYVFTSRELSPAFRANIRHQWAQMNEAQRVDLMRQTEAYRAACPMPQSWRYDEALSDFGSEADAVFSCIARNTAA